MSTLTTDHGVMPATARCLLPREAYVSQEWHDREQQTLFADSWSYAATLTELSNIGDYVTLNVGPYPLMVLRDSAGGLKAFHNLCRHRGNELLEGHGAIEGGRITCPYHRWTYDIDGNLQAVPQKAQCFPGLVPEHLGLLEAAVGEFKGLVFVHPEPDADFSQFLADLPNAAWPHCPGRYGCQPHRHL